MLTWVLRVLRRMQWWLRTIIYLFAVIVVWELVKPLLDVLVALLDLLGAG